MSLVRPYHGGEAASHDRNAVAGRTDMGASAPMAMATVVATAVSAEKLTLPTSCIRGRRGRLPLAAPLTSCIIVTHGELRALVGVRAGTWRNAYAACTVISASGHGCR
jgi:hypothetical protein